MRSHDHSVLAKRGHYRVAQAGLGDTRRSWVVFLLVRKVLPKEVDGGHSHLECDLTTTCLQDAIHLFPAQPGEKAQTNPDL